ncbi:MAG: hypothetical protein HY713_03690 [candidate division NC10 bacterium]|nr:hypothetical protein [candidate division NC10 bacterium]
MSVWREDRRVFRFRGNARKLNLFQQVMALWEEVHPYNAVYVIRLRGPADVTLLRFAIQTACHQAGVGTLVLDRKQARYRYDPFESITLQEIASGSLPCSGGAFPSRARARGIERCIRFRHA